MSIGSLIEISRCEVCGSSQLHEVLDLGRHPLCDDLIPLGSEHVCSEYPIEILLCDTCLTAHQKYQVVNTVLFPQNYHYRARFTADVLNGMRNLVDAVEMGLGSISGKTVLDIGCNDGSLLGFFKEKGATTVGIEPTGAAADAREAGHAILNDYLTPSTARTIVQQHGHPDIITFTNVFAHISNLDQVLESLRILNAPTTILVIENHYLGSVFSGGQFDTFYHEHPRTYSYRSFEFIAASLGLALLHAEFPARYGGNIRVFIGKDGLMKGSLATVAEQDYQHEFERLRNSIDVWKEKKGEQIARLVEMHGPLTAKAFPGRAAILVKLLGLDVHMIRATYERPGSKKIGHYVPGTRIPILSETELFASGSNDPVINLAWHISDEIRRYMSSHGYKGEVVDVLDKA